MEIPRRDLAIAGCGPARADPRQFELVRAGWEPPATADTGARDNAS